VDRSDEIAAYVPLPQKPGNSWKASCIHHSIDRLAANPPCPDRVLAFMDTNLLDIKFARIGARLKIADRAAAATAPQASSAAGFFSCWRSW
jgi:hypothetical protein